MRRFLSLILTVAMVVLSVGACDAAKKSSAVEGKVVDSAGKPIAGVKVIALQQQPLKGYERIETTTKADGTFVLKRLYTMAGYNLTYEGGQCNDANKNLSSAPTGETKMLQGNVVLKFSPFKKSSDGVITDPRTGLQWAPSNGKEINHYQAEEYIKNLSLAGGGWRMPTIAELRELNDTGKLGCGCNELLNGWLLAWSDELCTVPGTFSPGARYFIFGSDRDSDCDFRKSSFHTGRALAVRSPK